ncbi:MAG: hypothetical protein ACI4DW_03720 [Lachnospiraceae bacterium]
MSENATNEISKSKQKRMDIENARKDQHRKKIQSRLTAIIICLALIGVIGLSYLIYRINKGNSGTLSADTYNKYLTEEGLIENVTPADYVQFDYKGLSYNRADLLPDGATVDADIASTCESLAKLSEDTGLTTTSENKISLSYDATIGGVSYNSVQQQDYTIGSGSVSDQFDELLPGHNPGDNFQADITYPADYYDTELAGVTVTYNITIHGIYVVPEFTDELVAENFSSIASSAEEYRTYLTEEYFKSNLKDAITDSLTNGCTVLQYPQDYLANVEKIYLAQNENQFNYYNQMFYSSLGSYAYNSVYEMYGFTSDEEYRSSVHSMAQSDVAFYLSVMTVYAGEGMTNTKEDVMNYYYEQGYDDASFQELLTQYGYNYLAQMALADKVTNYLVDTVTITE